MSDSSFLEKYAEQSTQEERSPLAAQREDAPWEDLGSFGWLRGIGDRSIMLECRKSNGNIQAFGYGWLERATFDPSAGIALYFVGHEVRIIGRNLNHEERPFVRLFEGLLRHRVTWIAEAGRAQAACNSDGECVIEEIQW